MVKYTRIDYEVERFDPEGKPISAVVTTETTSGTVEKVQVSGASDLLVEMLASLRRSHFVLQK